MNRPRYARRPHSRTARRSGRSAWLAVALFFVCAGLTEVRAAPGDFPRPAELETDVAFWKRIYSEIATDSGLIHDTQDLGLVYEVLKIPSGLSSKARERHTEQRKKDYQQILLRLSKGKRTGLSREEKRVLGLFPTGVSDATLSRAAGRLRFQLGQADKFRAGVVRSGAYKPHVLQTLGAMNLPLEIAHLPHVESSYTPDVYSRVGAAGLWQFTRSTGRRFMRVDHVVDERLDPYRASIAAARLLEQNHRVTGTWPLAITAYNHGASGMRRAALKLGTRDITTIVRKYRSRSFGFASRNFYVEFLAANAIADDPEFYFGPLVLDRPMDFETMELPDYVSAKALANTLGVELATLRTSNPALQPTVWEGVKHVPKGYALRVPRAALSRPLAPSIAALPKTERHARQTRDADYVVQRGDTLSAIARRHGARTSDLVALNGLSSRNHIRIGQKLKLPTDTRRTATPPPPDPAPTAGKRGRESEGESRTIPLDEDGTYTVRRGDNLTRIADRFGLSVTELVALNNLKSRNRIQVGQSLRVVPGSPTSSGGGVRIEYEEEARGRNEASPVPGPREEELLLTDRMALEDPSEVDSNELTPEVDESATEPGAGLLADPTDYTVASNETILVQTDETLGHYAEWLGLRASRLRQINGLRFGEALVIQQRIRLDFSEVSREAFERVRIDFHRALQEDFFAAWEIEGTITHRVGKGESLWLLSTQRYAVPIWLLRQYNPDVNLDALTAGTSLTVPRLKQRAEAREAIADAG